jgi:hypothetical protein
MGKPQEGGGEGVMRGLGGSSEPPGQGFYKFFIFL